MKKTIYLLLSYLLTASCASVKNSTYSLAENVSVQTSTVEIPDVSNSGMNIKATEYKFPFVVRNIVVDTTEMKALVRLKKADDKPTKIPSIIVYYDLMENQVLWSNRSFAWFPFFLQDKILLRTFKGELSAVDKKTGVTVWERTGGYKYINKENNVGITQSLTAFDLDTGVDIWHRDIDSQFGWDEMKIDGKTLIASIDGLPTLDLHNGSGWDISMATGKKDELGAVAKNAGLVALSALSMSLGGSPVTGTAKANEFSGMVSNILTCGNHIFFAAKDNLICVEKETGKEIWRTSLPESRSAKSILTEDGDNIFIANQGYCYKNKEFHLYGTPYIAKFDKTSGELLFSENLDMRLYIQDVQLAKDGYFLITENELLHFNSNGKLNKKLKISENNYRYGKNLKMLTEKYPFKRYFVSRGQEFEPLDNYWSNPNMPVIETEESILFINPNLEIEHSILKNQIYFVTAENLKTKLLRSAKYSTLRRELSSLEWKIKYGSIGQRKRTKQKYAQLKEDNKDLLVNIYLINNKGEIQGRVEITKPILSTSTHFYYSTESGLTLVSEKSLD